MCTAPTLAQNVPNVPCGVERTPRAGRDKQASTLVPNVPCGEES